MSDDESCLETSQHPDFYIFTSYLWANVADCQQSSRYGKHLHLPLHRRRLLSSAQALGWFTVVNFLNSPAGFDQLIRTIEAHLQLKHDTEEIQRKIKVCVYRDSQLRVESAIVHLSTTSDLPFPRHLDEKPHPSPSVVKLDTEPICPSLFTRHKTSNRGQYGRARETAAISHEPPDMAEVLIFNTQHEVMECSVSTPYFRREDQWVTPPLSSGGNEGVTRQIALERGLCEEKVVRVESLQHGEPIWISNGVRGLIPGVVHLGNHV